MFIGALLLGSLLAPQALAQSSNTLQDDVPGSLLVFPIFDVIGGNQTKIRVTCNGTTGTTLRFTYICQPLGTSSSSLFCPSFDENIDCTPHQTLVLDIGTQLFAACPTGQGFIVVWAETLCRATSASFNPNTNSCATATGGFISLGEFAPISYNQLFGSYHLYFNGFANAPGVSCGGVPCSPPPIGIVPDLEAANAIAVQSQQPVFSFLGTDAPVGLTLTFGPTTAFDYVSLPKTVETDFAAPGAALIAGPPPIPPDTSSGLELQTNIILLNMNYSQFAAIPTAAMSVNAWNWFEIGFTSTHRFICWERIPINLIDARITAAGPFGAPYGNIRFTPSPLAGATSPQLLGAIEEVADVGRTIRNMIHSSTAASPATFITDIER
jgi:hypothetical protein